MNATARIFLVVFLLSTGSAGAQDISIVQGSDGMSGTVIDLGGGLRSYSDSHGNRGTIMDLGGGMQTYQFSSPEGRLRSGTILTLPAPNSNLNPSPAGLTPAPVLPFFPKGTLMPREQPAPVTPFGSSSIYGGYGAGRVGR